MVEDKPRLREIGKIAKTYGFRGEVLIRIAENITEDFQEPESLFLLIEGRAVPFMVESAVLQGSRTLLVKFRWYDTAESIAEFTGCTVLVEAVDFKPALIPDHRMLEGYTVIDEEGAERGVIVSVAARRHQWLATVETAAGTTFLLPVHEDLVLKIDSAGKSIKMMVPDGIENL